MHALKSTVAHGARPRTAATQRRTLAASNSSASTPTTPVQQQQQQPSREAYKMYQVPQARHTPEYIPPVPLDEHVRRRRVRDLEEITSAGKKRGVSAQLIASNLEQVEALLPGLVNLHKAKAADWLLILSDVNAFTTKLILLRGLFPTANLQKVLSSQPKLMLKTQEQLQKDAAQVRKILSSAPNPDAIIEAYPDLINPISLMRSLAFIENSFKGSDPVTMLVKHPDILMNMGEASIADSAEYNDNAWDG